MANVTGANSGIGLAECVALSRGGHTVYAGIRHTASADVLLAATAALSDRLLTIHVVRMDMGDDGSVAAAVAVVLAATGDGVDVAVANAGYNERLAVEDAAVRVYAAMMNVKFLGALRLVQACVPSMRRRRAGWVLGVSNVARLMRVPLFGAFSASKFVP